MRWVRGGWFEGRQIVQEVQAVVPRKTQILVNAWDVDWKAHGGSGNCNILQPCDRRMRVGGVCKAWAEDGRRILRRIRREKMDRLFIGEGAVQQVFEKRGAAQRLTGLSGDRSGG